jgi:hypothetical protein
MELRRVTYCRRSVALSPSVKLQDAGQSIQAERRLGEKQLEYLVVLR